MPNTRQLVSTVVAMSALLVAGGALADTDPPQPCMADVKKLCPKVKPGNGAILACLEANQEKISAECKDSATAKAQVIYEACKPDKDKFCADVKEGEGRILKCLGQHQAQMSAACKDVWAKAKAGKAKAEAQLK